MALSGISTASLSQNLRTSLIRAQVELSRAQKEAAEGRIADPARVLGSLTAQSVSASRDLGRLENIVDTNALAGARLSATQDALKQLGTSAQSFLSALTVGESGSAAQVAIRDTASGALSGMASVLNTSLNGEYLFAGVNTDVAPLNAWEAGAPAKDAFDAAFLSYFGFAQNDPAIANISASAMSGFLDAVTPQFLGAAWGNWSNASDAPIQSRIALNETAATSVSANTSGVRKLAMASGIMSELFSGGMSEAARGVLRERATGLVSGAIGDLSSLQAATGIIQNRVSAASERLTAQAGILETHLQKLEGLDPYEASTRVTTLLSQIETSYALTARLQQLSLSRFLS